MQREFKKKIGSQKNLIEIKRKITHGSADYHEANIFSIAVGEVLAEVFRENLSSNQLPQGKMYYNIAKKVVEPMLRQNHSIISDNTADIQELLNRSSNLGIVSRKPSFNQDRADGIIQRLADEENFDDIKWILDEPVVNFSQSIVDDFIKENADFHYKSGLRPKIVRSANPGCCEWCSNIVGEYDYPNDMPDDIFRRHRYCRCEVNYFPGDGRRQDSHSKQWR